MTIITKIKSAQQFIRDGKIIAYPTEAVYGLGCDPFNQQAVERLLSLKSRSWRKGLILLIANWAQLETLISDVPHDKLSDVRRTWPGPVTWVFPKSENVPDWISGEHKTIAIRMSAHPIAKRLSTIGPLVSTSANVSGFSPARNINDLRLQFPDGIDAIISGDLGHETKPSAMYDVITGQRLR